MASPLDIINRSGRQAVQVYAPRGLPQRPAPTKRTTPKKGERAGETRGGTNWQAVEQAFAPVRQKQAAQQEEEGGEGFWGGGFGKGLGFLIGNPVTQTLLKPLQVLDTGRKGAVLGFSEAAQAIPDSTKIALSGLPVVGGAMQALRAADTERIDEDPRSNWTKMGDPQYGFGQIAEQTGNKWVDRGVGLAGDIALDPLTYMTLGTSKVAATPVEGLTREVAMHAGRANRASELADLSRRLPVEVMEELAPDIQRAGVRGLGTASPALRDVMGLSQPQLRFMGARIPGTQPIGRALAGTGGVVREQLAKVANPLARGPKGLEAALSTVTRRGTEMDTPRALTQIALSEDIRRGEGMFTTAGNRMISNLYRDTIKGMDKDAVRQMVRDTERGLDTPLKQFFDTIPEVFKEVSGGTDIAPYMRQGYFPHMLTGSARRMLRKALDKEDPLARDFMEKLGFTTDDLLESSSHLAKSRVLAPNPDGTPKTITIGGRDLTIQSGDLDEINDSLRKLFPGYTGKFYEDDPIRVMESYVNSVARQAGRDKGLKGMVDVGNPFVRKIEGELADEVEARNNQLSKTTPLIDEIEKGWSKGDPIVDIPEAAELPEPTDMFKSRVLTDVTRKRDQTIIQKSRKVGKEMQAEARDLRDDVVKSLETTKKNMMQGLKDEAKVDSPRIKELDQVIAGYEKRLGELAPMAAEGRDNLAAFMVGIGKDIDELEAEIRRSAQYLKGRTTKEMKRIEAKLRGSLDTMRGVQRRAQALADSAPREVAEAVRRRTEELLRPVRKAREAIEAKARTVPGRPDPDRVAWASEVVERGSRESGTAAQIKAEYAAVMTEMQALGSANTGKLTAKQKRMADALIAQKKRDLELRAQQLGLELGGGAGRQQTSDYLEALAELDALKAAPTKENAARRGVLSRQINSGKFSDERKAREVLAQQAAWEQKVAVATRPEQRKLREAQLFVESSDEWQALSGQAAKEVQRREALAADRTARLRGEEMEMARRADPMAKPGLVAEAEGQARQAVRATGEKAGQTEGQIVDDLARRQTINTEVRDAVYEQQTERIALMEEETSQVSANLNKDMQERARLKSKRTAAEQRLKTMEKVKPGRNKAKTAELQKNLNDTLAVAKANPRLVDADLATTESLLHSNDQALQRAEKLDIRAKDVQSIIDAAYNEKLAPIMLTVVNDNWKMLHDGVLARGDTIVDAELYRRYQLLYEGMKDPKLFGRTLNAATNMFKTYATLSPGFHVRNAISAVFMNSSDGVPMQLQMRGFNAWQQYMKGGREWLLKQSDEMKQAVEIASGSGAGGRFLESGVAQSADNAVYNALVNNRATRWSQRQGERVEGGVRLGMALDSLRRGETPQEALARITRIHFDYGQVSKFDEQAKRLIPFWTFMSRNMPMQVSQMWTKPRLYAQYNSLIRNFASDPLEYTPEYWLDAGAWNTGTEVPNTDLPVVGNASNLPIYLAPDLGFTRLDRDFKDIEDFLSGENMGGVLSNVNPVISAPIEFAMKQDAFTGQKFDESDYSEVGGPLGLPARALAQLLGQTNEAGQVSDNFMNAVRSVNPLQDRSSRLLPQLSGGDEEAKTRQLESIARFLGVPVRTLTPTQQTNEAKRRYFDVLREYERQQAMLQAAAG